MCATPTTSATDNPRRVGEVCLAGQRTELSQSLAPDGLRVAVWCPQGREELPLAAALCRTQLPADLIVWSSDEPSPAEPTGLSADLWLVLCVSDPPLPPSWRHGVNGIWIVFPGTVVNWTARTRETTDEWRPNQVLTDLLPDETDNPVWAAWQATSEFAWLPACGDALAPPTRRQTLVLAAGADVPLWLREVVLPALAAAFGTRVIEVAGTAEPGRVPISAAVPNAERVVLCSQDAVLLGVVLRQCAHSGTEAFIWGRHPSLLRESVLGGTPTGVFGWPVGAGRLSDSIRPLVAALAARDRVRPQPTDDVPWDWGKWIASLGRGGGFVAQHGVRTSAVLHALSTVASEQALAWVLKGLVGERGARPRRLHRDVIQRLGLQTGLRPSPVCRRITRAALGGEAHSERWLMRLTQPLPQEYAGVALAVIQRWFDARLAAIWSRRIAPAVLQEIELAVQTLAALSPYLDQPARSARARLLAHANRVTESREALVDYARHNGGKVVEMAAAVAFSFWRVGNLEAARDTLRFFPLESPTEPFAMLLFAAAAELLGMWEESAAALRLLRAQVPCYLGDVGAADSRWAIASVIFALGGMAEAALAMRRRAELVPQSCYLLALSDGERVTLTPEWIDFSADALAAGKDRTAASPTLL